MQQLNLPKSSGWGGARHGAGRKPCKKKVRQNHVARPLFKRNTPLHVTIKLQKGLCGLRCRKGFQLLKSAVKKAQLHGLRVIQFSLQSNHVHLILEADNKQVLAKGMQAFNISFSKRFNSWKRRSGSVFFDRYHLHILKSLKEVKNALRYVLLNSSKHHKTQPIMDLYSSAPHFFLWKELIGRNLMLLSSLTPYQWIEMDLVLCEILQQPLSWQLQTGWLMSRGGFQKA